MDSTLATSEHDKKRTEESLRAIKYLIHAAEQSRKLKSKSTNYLDSYFKKVRSHIL